MPLIEDLVSEKQKNLLGNLPRSKSGDFKNGNGREKQGEQSCVPSLSGAIFDDFLEKIKNEPGLMEVLEQTDEKSLFEKLNEYLASCGCLLSWAVGELEDYCLQKYPENKFLQEFIERMKFMARLEEQVKQDEPFAWEAAIDKWYQSKIEHQKSILEKKLVKNEQGVNREQLEKQAEEETKQKIKKVLRYIFTKPVTHGRYQEILGERVLNDQETDLDGRVSIGLLKMAAGKEDGSEDEGSKSERKMEKEKYVGNDLSEINDLPANGSIIADVGWQDGVALLKKIGRSEEQQTKRIDIVDSLETNNELQQVVKDGGLANFFRHLSVIIDHHPTGAFSAAHQVFKLLDKLNLIEYESEAEKAALKKMVKFLDIQDSYGWQAAGDPDFFAKSDRTILGLSKFMNFEQLKNFFEDDGDYTRQLTDAELEKYGLGETQEKRKKNINRGLGDFKFLEKRGCVVDSRFGKILLNVGKQMQLGQEVAYSQGVSYLGWYSNTKKLVLFVPNEKIPEGLFEPSLVIRDHLLIMPMGSDYQSKLSFEKVLQILEITPEPNSFLADFVAADKLTIKKLKEMAEQGFDFEQFNEAEKFKLGLLERDIKIEIKQLKQIK